MTTVVVPAFNASGAPLTGLSPSWYCIFDAALEVAYTPAPAIGEIGTSGVYKFAQPEGIDITGIIDLGASATPRYMAYGADNYVTFVAWDVTPTPLAGLTVVWNVCVDVEGNAFTPQPIRVELGLGMYKIERHTGRAVGILDTVTGVPRYIAYDSEDARAIAIPVTPDSPIALTAISDQVVSSDLAGDLELGTNGELVLSETTGDLVLVTGMKGIGQACQLAILSFEGEWFADLESGVPWYQDILGQKREEAKVRTAMREALLSVDGVTKIERLELSWEGTSRTLSVDWEVTAVSGQLVSGATTL